MDSLLLVLAVIGVVMILAGVARMRNRRSPNVDEIDHSVLFNSDEVTSPSKPAARESVMRDEFSEVEPVTQIPEDDDFEVVRKTPRAFAEQRLSAEHIEPQSLEVDDARQSEVSIMVDPEDRPQKHEKSEPVSAPKKRSRSLLDKLVGESDDDDLEEAEPIRGYRDEAPEKVIVLNVMAPQGRLFVGTALVDEIENSGMVFGEEGIFHALQEKQPLFSLISMVKPGVFDMTTIEELATPGVSLFIQLPNGLGNGLESFDKMLATANTLAKKLGGDLRDERRNILTNSAIDYLRQQVAEYDCKWRLTA